MTTDPHPRRAEPAIRRPAGSQSAPPSPSRPPPPPSVHVRAVITWLAIFPLVAIGMMLIAPISESWHPVLRAFALTLVVVPLAVYVVVPQLHARRYVAAPRVGAGGA